jgi:hypothetical protein
VKVSLSGLISAHDHPIQGYYDLDYEGDAKTKAEIEANNHFTHRTVQSIPDPEMESGLS